MYDRVGSKNAMTGAFARIGGEETQHLVVTIRGSVYWRSERFSHNYESNIDHYNREGLVR